MIPRSKQELRAGQRESTGPTIRSVSRFRRMLYVCPSDGVQSALSGDMSAIPKPDPTRLVESYRSYAHAIAAEVLRKLPPSVDRDDVRAAAELGLVEAARAFDPSRNVLFKTFAYYRIRGQIYDDLRKAGCLSRQPAARFEAAANEYMKDYTGGPAAPASTADALAELQQLTFSIVSSYVLSLDSLMREVPDSQPSPEQACAERETSRRVRAALAQMPSRNREVLEAYYFGDATLDDIGKKLGLSKSWVCRLHAKSLDMLRELLERPAAQSATT
jgi:RNA polymerase sigma factor for flagellar operon FliA